MTMAHCTDESIGLKLHAYELGMLDDAERSILEQHLLECDYCFKIASKHEDAMRMLSTDHELQQQIIDDFNNSEKKASESSGGTPQGGRFNIIRLVAIAAIILLAVTSFFVFDNWQDQSHDSTQLIRFSNLRSNGTSLIDKSISKNVKFQFPLDAGLREGTFSTYFEPIDGSGRIKKFNTSLDVSGYGEIHISTARFNVGLYNLVVEISNSTSTPEKTEYTFRVK